MVICQHCSASFRSSRALGAHLEAARSCRLAERSKLFEENQEALIMAVDYWSGNEAHGVGNQAGGGGGGGGLHTVTASNCIKQTCDFCEESDEMYVESGSICESCMVFCDDCEDLVFHKACLVEHLKICNKKSRAQRALASVKKEQEQTEQKLEEAKTKVTVIQHSIESYENDLVRLKQDEDEAEKDLKSEMDAEAKKKNSDE